MFGKRFFGARYFGGRFFGDSEGLDAPVVNGGKHFGSWYFGRRHFGPRYFGMRDDNVAWLLEPTNTLAIAAGTVSTSAEFVLILDSHPVEASNSIPLAGVVAVSGALSIGGEDWSVSPPLNMNAFAFGVTVASSFVIEQSGDAIAIEVTQGPALSGTVLASTGDIGLGLDVNQENAELVGAGELLIAGDLVYGVAIEIEPAVEDAPGGGGGKRRRYGFAAHDDAAQRAENEAREFIEMLMAVTAAGVFDDG